ncbi:restriction endonuclease subunit S [Morganella morganii subsp. morganii]|uniref:restriction endonuclease subunit S n=1 Tax=Morganella morganii TaxID=582 RepID=UPI001BDB2A92|nr:restriction endonuclease subunit S [Morganella morganii]MBT0475493.1 restriction endonuclease subunit S [Morganella morganii subsp. morganii]
MSELNYLEKLLNGVEVEWKTIGDVTSVLRGKRLTKNLLSAEEEFPVFHGGLEPLGYYNKSNRPANTVMIINVGASAGTVGYSTVDFWSSDGCFCLEQNELLDNRFLYFALIGYQSLLKSKVRIAGIPTLDAIVVNKLLIPIPCPGNPEMSLAIQSEIVRILDTFTTLTAELTAELTARKKQYDYYRDQLLSFKYGWISPYMEKLLDGVEVEWLPLELIAKIKHGKDWKGLGKGIVPVYGSGGVMGYVDTCSYDQPSVLIPRKGSITNIFYVEAPFWNVDTIYYTDIETSKIIPKYLYHFIKTIDLMALDTGSGRPSLTQAILNKLHIPIPCPNNPEKSLSIQAEIVRILDKFDKLTGSITEGLPREIELRQKQYEYYRDLLFSFPKPESVNH